MTSLRRLTYSLKSNPGGLQNSSMIDFVISPSWVTFYASSSVYSALFLIVCEEETSDPRMIISIRYGFSKTCFKSKVSVEKLTVRLTTASSFPHELCLRRSSQFVEIPITPTLCAFICVQVAWFPTFTDLKMSNVRMILLIRFGLSSTWGKSLWSVEKFTLHTTIALSVPLELYPIRDSWLCRGGSWNGHSSSTYSIFVYESFSAMNFAASVFMVHVFWAYELTVWHAVSSFSIMETIWTIWKGGRGSWLIDL